MRPFACQKLLFAICFLCLPAILAAATKVTLNTSPEKGGRIFLDGKFVGVAPVTLKLKMRKNQIFTATADKDGCVGIWPREFTKAECGKGTILIRLEQDKVFNETIESEIANKWLTLQARHTVDESGKVDEDRVWQKIVSVVTDNFSDLEQMDSSSFYLRTAWRVRRFPFAAIRHRLVVKKGVTVDLTIKFKIESQIFKGNVKGPIPNERFEPSFRIFPEDKDTHDFLRDQL